MSAQALSIVALFAYPVLAIALYTVWYVWVRRL